MGRLLPALQVPGYPLWWAAGGLGALTFFAGAVAQGWLVLTLTDSPWWLGVTGGVSGIAMAATAPWAGVLVDRWDRRLILIGTGLAGGAILLALALLVITDRVTLWHVLLAASLSSALGAFGLPAAQAFTFDLVGRQRLVNAVGLGFLSFNIAGILGPALAGTVIQRWGIGEAYLVMAAAQWTAALLLLRIRTVRSSSRQAFSLFDGMRGLVSLLRGHAQLRQLVLLSVVVEAFAYSYIVILPAMARDVLGLGPAGFGLLAAVAGVGASGGSLAVAALGNMRRKSLAVLIGAFGFGLFLVLFALSPGFVLAAPLIALVGAATALYNVALSSLLQLLVPEALRGRAMGLYIFTWGFMFLGGFPLGAVARWLSVPTALALGGGLVMAYTLARGRTIARISEPVGSPTGLS